MKAWHGRLRQGEEQTSLCCGSAGNGAAGVVSTRNPQSVARPPKAPKAAKAPKAPKAPSPDGSGCRPRGLRRWAALGLAALPCLAAQTAQLPGPDEYERVHECRKDGEYLDFTRTTRPQEFPPCVETCSEWTQAMPRFCVKPRNPETLEIRAHFCGECESARVNEWDVNAQAMSLKMANLFGVHPEEVVGAIVHWPRDGNGTDEPRLETLQIVPWGQQADPTYPNQTFPSEDDRRLEGYAVPSRLPLSVMRHAVCFAFRMETARVTNHSRGVKMLAGDEAGNRALTELLGMPVQVRAHAVQATEPTGMRRAEFRGVYKFENTDPNQSPGLNLGGLMDVPQDGSCLGPCHLRHEVALQKAAGEAWTRQCISDCDCNGQRWCDAFGYCTGNTLSCREAQTTEQSTSSTSSASTTSSTTAESTTRRSTTRETTTSTSLVSTWSAADADREVRKALTGLEEACLESVGQSLLLTTATVQLEACLGHHSASHCTTVACSVVTAALAVASGECTRDVCLVKDIGTDTYETDGPLSFWIRTCSSGSLAAAVKQAGDTACSIIAADEATENLRGQKRTVTSPSPTERSSPHMAALEGTGLSAGAALVIVLLSFCLLLCMLQGFWLLALRHFKCLRRRWERWKQQAPEKCPRTAGVLMPFMEWQAGINSTTPAMWTSPVSWLSPEAGESSNAEKAYVPYLLTVVWKRLGRVVPHAAPDRSSAYAREGDADDDLPGSPGGKWATREPTTPPGAPRSPLRNPDTPLVSESVNGSPPRPSFLNPEGETPLNNDASFSPPPVAPPAGSGAQNPKTPLRATKSDKEVPASPFESFIGAHGVRRAQSMPAKARWVEPEAAAWPQRPPEDGREAARLKRKQEEADEKANAARTPKADRSGSFKDARTPKTPGSKDAKTPGSAKSRAHSQSTPGTGFSKPARSPAASPPPNSSQSGPKAAGTPQQPRVRRSLSTKSQATTVSAEDFSDSEALSPEALEAELQRLRQLSSPAERRRLYLARCLRWHPDKNVGDEDRAKVMFQVLQEHKEWFLGK
eukprot:TRINITY_DN18983_c0_g1_i1.p1 TRINITY_DN18983_c0_g1~~TRINITY_DN18983_c0_g1_i1.p1  ORF type:complete len:1036 (-),score=195.13 TRINITY_DN18983_c0_g1_i1:92-3199(-)